MKLDMPVPAPSVSAELIARSHADIKSGVPHAHYKMECIRNGKVVWTEEADNLVTRVGCNGSGGLLDATFKTGVSSPTWYVGLIDTGSTFATTDTMSSHSGWTEATPYSNATRPAWTPGSISTGSDTASVDNSGAVAAFTINASDTVLGAFLVNNSTKGGTTGILYGEATFTSRSVLNGDTLNVTVTLTVTAG